MITFILFSVFATWKFYIAFAACITAYRQWVKKSLNIYNKVLFFPALIGFYITDVFFNWTLLNLMFGKPPKGTKTISDRFEYYHKVEAPSEFAKQVATFTCEKLLNTVDPSGQHC